MDEVQQYVRVSLNVEQMTDLAGILTELDSKTNKLRKLKGFNDLCTTVDEAFHLLLVDELLPEQLQVLSNNSHFASECTLHHSAYLLQCTGNNLHRIEILYGILGLNTVQ